jgi:hypothetical protein
MLKLKVLIGVAASLAVTGAMALGAGAADEARVRVIHASPDAPNVDVYANGNAVLTDVPFEASSGYLAVPAGSYTFEVFPAGADSNATEPVISIDADLESGTDYTVAAIGELAQIEAAVFVDDNTAPAAGKAHIYAVHAGPDAPAVDIAVAGGPVLVSDLAFGERAGPLPVDAAAYDLEVRPSGTTDVALPLDGVQIEAGMIYTFVATGFLEGEPELTVLPFAEQPQAAPAGTQMKPPSAGSGGLVGQSDGGNAAVYAAGAAVIAGLVVAGAAARVVASRR